MTLFKQIALLVTLVFLLMSAILLANNFQQNARFLQGQMQSSAQDMATALGIAISNLPDGEDPATLETLFNAVFDSGFYSLIELIGVDGRVIQTKGQRIQIEGVPQWFIDWLPLKPAEGVTTVMKGWTQLGRLRLVLHPGYFYSSLYEALIGTLKWFALLFLLSMALLWLLLHVLLRPLKKIREQADAIAHNRFELQHRIPRTPELKSAVIAMNRLSERMQSLFDEQQRNLDRYARLLYRDEASGLGNRRYLLEQLEQMESEESSFHGCLCVIRISHFEEQREYLGYEWGDRLLLELADLLKAEYQGLHAEKPARLGDREFAFLLESDEEAAVAMLASLFRRLRDLPALHGLGGEVYPLGAVVSLGQGRSSDWLASADYALSRAESRGALAIELGGHEGHELPRGRQAWRAWLEQLIKQKRLFLVSQSALTREGEVRQQELLLRAYDERQQAIPASAFMPMAAGLGLSLEIDRQVFEMIRGGRCVAVEAPLALNLSAAFFEAAELQPEFDLLMQHCREHGVTLCVEASHHVLLRHPLMRERLAQRIAGQGHRLGIDNLDPSLPLDLLQQTAFSYVKINARTLAGDSERELAASYQSLKTMTDALGVELIVVGVDSEALYRQLLDLGVEVMQGNWLAHPQQSA